MRPRYSIILQSSLVNKLTQISVGLNGSASFFFFYTMYIYEWISFTHVVIKEDKKKRKTSDMQ